MPSFHTYASCLAVYITLYSTIVFGNIEKFVTSEKIRNSSKFKTKMHGKKKSFTLRIILTLVYESNVAPMELGD